MTYSAKAGYVSRITTASIVILGLALLFCCAFTNEVQAGNAVPSVNSAQALKTAQNNGSGQALEFAQNDNSVQGNTVVPALLGGLGFVLPEEKHIPNISTKKQEISVETPVETSVEIPEEVEEITSSGDDYTDLDNVTEHNPNTGEFNYKTRPDDNLLIVGVLVDELVLDEGFLVYLDDEDIIVPLSAFVELLGFPINVQPETGEAKGWFIKEEDKFELQRPYKFIDIKGNRIQILNNEIIENHIDDIYVNKELIEKWFPVQLDFNFQELRIYLSTSEELPFQTTAKRHELWESAKKQSSKAGLRKVGKDVIRFPYKKFSFPTVQVSQNANSSKSASGSKQTTASHSVLLQGDLLGMDMRADIGYQQRTVGSSQMQRSAITLSKEDFEGNIGGFLNATRFELGDISTYQFPLAGGNSRGRGFKISNAPVSFVRDPDEHIVEGFAPVGWDVEVYQDDRLLDFTRIQDDGRYRFEALPLRTGFNLFHIVMYGPNGEKREEFQRLYLGNNMVEPGKFVYEVSGLQSSSPLFDLRIDKSKETDPTASILGEYGLSKNLSVNMGYYTGPVTDTDNLDGVGMGARASGKSMFGQLNTFRNKDGGRSISADVRGNLGKNITWGAGHSINKGYALNVKRTLEESFVRMSQNLSLKHLPKLGYSFDVRRQILETGERRFILTNRASSTFFGLNLSNNIEYVLSSVENRDQTLGKLTIHRKLPIGILRSNINYSLDKKATIDSITIQLQKNVSEKISLNALLSSVFGVNPINTLSGGVDIKFNKYRLGLTSSLSDVGDKRVGMNLSYNFIPQSFNGDYKITGDSVNNGHLILKPFLDLNQDGMRTENEELLAGIKFRNMLRGTEGTTNEEGTVVLAGLGPNTVNEIIIQQDTLPDIYMTPAKEKIKVLGRKGVNGPVYVAIQQLGEISGIITSFDPKTNEEIELPDITIRLLDKNGATVAETVTEYDGFYSFPSLPMGLYEMFFPNTKALDIHYTGEGAGPRFELSIDEPEIAEGNVVVTRNQIGFEDEISEDSMGSSTDGPTNIEASKKTGFIGIISNPINSGLKK